MRAVSNVYKKKKDYRNAEDVLLQGTDSSMASTHSHEHPFWCVWVERVVWETSFKGPCALHTRACVCA